LTAWRLCNVFWDAGVSRNTLQFLPCSGSAEGRQLTGHPQVDFVILTGGTSTALQILSARPDLFLAAETGGKNSTIVTAVADREQAVRNIIQSAFGHSGQKCSATSLLILDKEVYNDRHFKQMLVDATASLPVGPAWDFSNRMGPLIHPPRGALLRGLTRLEHGEAWALAPGQAGDNPNLWTPGIKWGVQPGSFTHMTELFGPVLGVMRADDLEEAVALANQTGYGLTAGIESLDPRETDRWKSSIRAGNLYINRSTTGAVTLRQPFGGMGKSAVGPAIKAGGPDYVTQFMTFSEIESPPIKVIREAHPLLVLAQRWQRQCRWGQMQGLSGEVQKIVSAIQSYLHIAQEEFLSLRDYFHLRGQDNLLRHIPAGRFAVCLHPEDSIFETVARLAAARISGCRVVLIRPPGLDNAATQFLDGEEGGLLLSAVQIRIQDEAQTAGQMSELDRLRYAAPDRVPPPVSAAAAEAGVYIARDPVLMYGRVELLHYLLGQSICDTYHRHGNLGERGFAGSAP
jgi:RHH-type transcriptional regulator, proline utilization regulon repressor / proline dehydrogenase / delta 1-pyrroline-5-carboxylate dehydrogenase